MNSRGRKRDATDLAVDNSYDPDPITVALPVKRRRQSHSLPSPASAQVLQELNASQLHNVRTRHLKCVLIPATTSHPSSANHVTPCHAPTQSSDQLSQTIGGRPQRSNARRSYVYYAPSEDENDAFTPPDATRPNRHHAKPADDSDFEEAENALKSASETHVFASSSEDLFGSEDEDESSPAPKPTVRARIRTAKSGRMRNLLSRDKCYPARDLVTSLPPLSDISDIFEDITSNALAKGLKDVLNHFGTRPLRVATMCSGTESPLLALQMVRDSLQKLCGQSINIDHLFSGEIVPVKQAYIERNFKPPIIFRDITEITAAVNMDVPMATNAYGAKVPIPTDIDIMIAGVSCVDASRLNNSRKGLAEGGESGKTWEAVFAYCKAYRPAIVIIENVRGAEWDVMLDSFESVDYVCSGVHVDTKNFYIPHTRQRGYIACFDKTKMPQNGQNVEKRWQDLMQAFQRPASSPVTEFLLSCDKVETTADIDDTVRVYDWDQCEISQMLYRQRMRLGTARPFTHWQESGAISVPENGSAPWFRRQVERVKDTIDCCILRKALPKQGMYDSRFKTRIWDLSQNIYRFEDTAPFGVSSCLTPSGIFFLSDANRIITPEESLTLQGLPLDRISFTTETPAELQDLAGNAMTTTVVGPAILAALISGFRAIHVADRPSAVIAERPKVSQLDHNKKLAPVHLSSAEPIPINKLIELASRASRRCYCEGLHAIAARPIQECSECGHTTCEACGGNPTHNYRRSNLSRLLPSTFEQSLKNQLPLQIVIGGLDRFEQLFDSAVAQEYVDAATVAFHGLFSFTAVHRAEQYTASYTAPGARLDLVFDDTGAQWRLYGVPSKTLPADNDVRILLEQPIALCTVSGSLLEGVWQWRRPVQRSVKMRMQGEGTFPSWWARSEMPDFVDHKIWKNIKVVIPKGDTLGRGVAAQIEGTYRHLPDCGTANDSLYQRVTSSDDGRPMFLFRDPSRTGLPCDDCFVFARDKGRLEYGTARLVIARIEPSWTPWNRDSEVTKPQLKVDGTWEPLSERFPHVAIRAQDPHAKILVDRELKAPQRCETPLLLSSCLVAGCNIPDTADITRLYKPCSTDVWMFEAIRRHLPKTKWRSLTLADPEPCTTCAPSKPEMRWALRDNHKTLYAYEDAASAADYERLSKTRPEPMVIHRRVSNGQIRIDFGLDLASLAHRAQAKLPLEVQQKRMDWRLEHSVQSSNNHMFKPFSIKSTVSPSTWSSADEYSGLSCQLFPKQRVALAWMQAQEQGVTFTLEESQESQIPHLGWRVEVRARAAIDRRGGICADHPGFGKTILCLALIQSQLRDHSSKAIVQDLRDRGHVHTQGLIHIHATLIVVPEVLLKGVWLTEIKEKVQSKLAVVVINSVNDLAQLKIDDFKRADIVLLNCKVLAHENYAERLAIFAAVPGPATRSGRAYLQWQSWAAKQVPEHLRILEDHGLQALTSHVKQQYKARIESDDLRAVMPSRRLRGKAFVEGAKDKRKPQSERPANTNIDTNGIDSPLFEMFMFNRLIVDEFHQCNAKEYAAITALHADKRWGMSATPAMNDFYETARMAALLAIPLNIGNLSRGTMRRQNIKTLRDEMTNFERFDAMREAPSGSMYARLHEHHQSFLDTFVRRNVLDFAELSLKDHLAPCYLEQDHQALYFELCHHLNSQDMTIRKISKTKQTDREVRLTAAIADSETAEEALTKSVAFYSRRDGGTAIDGLSKLVARRQQECDAILQALKTAISALGTANEVFIDISNTLIRDKSLGDSEAIDQIKQVFDSTGTGSDRAKPKSKADKPEKMAEGPNAQARSLGAPVNKLARRYTLSLRSLRYTKNLLRIQHALGGNGPSKKIGNCDRISCSTTKHRATKLAVSAVCGHTLCQDCHSHMNETHSRRCEATGCSAPMHDFHLLRANRMDRSAQAGTKHCAKIQTMLQILDTIKEKKEQAILFVQYPNQVDEVGEAIMGHQISATIVRGTVGAGDQIATFRTNNDTVLVLNASDETAAGSNLQNANHVIFFSPLLRSSQYVYDSTMQQAIGRVRRYGQKREIHVYRVVAVHTIDVDILEHRERRSDCLTEQGAPDIDAPPASDNVNEDVESGKERTQLVQENGRFSLRPRSWLRSGDMMESDNARVCGWDDFSSLVKFSKVYAEGDD